MPQRNRSLASAAIGLALSAVALLTATAPARAQGDLAVSDIGLTSGFQGYLLGHFLRGRATVFADFNLDGRPDVYLGNPGDESLVLVNAPGPNGRLFKLAQVLVTDDFTWGAAAADYDNDGDYDLFIPCGGNEGDSFNYLFKNMFIEEGRLRFVDVTEAAGVKGVVPDGGTDPARAHYANAVWGDYDRDGDVDLFVNVNDSERQQPGAPGIHGPTSPGVKPSDLDCGLPPGQEEAGEPLVDRNVLWRNNGDGTFTDVTVEVGLDATRFRPTRHSTFFDADNDGDLDLYENNHFDLNVLWRNLLVESGSATFEDATAAFSPPGEDLQYPFGSFVSCSADFNQDGWEDLIVFKRGPGITGPYPEGHALFLNQGGTGFVNVAEAAALNNPFEPQDGVMGSMIGDVNADGLPDVYVGNGSPTTGQYDQLFLSDGELGAAPHFINRSDLIDFEAPKRNGITYPPYPYRTHGTGFVDVDGDGTLEIAVNNGGPVAEPDIVREPNRLFKLTFSDPAGWLAVRPVGDGAAVSRDAIGTRFALTVSMGGGTPWTLYRTLFAGSCFSAQNGFDVHFYVGDADTVHELRVSWPDGEVDTVTEGLAINGSFVIERAPGSVPRVRREES